MKVLEHQELVRHRSTDHDEPDESKQKGSLYWSTSNKLAGLIMSRDCITF